MSRLAVTSGVGSTRTAELSGAKKRSDGAGSRLPRNVGPARRQAPTSRTVATGTGAEREATGVPPADIGLTDGGGDPTGSGSDGDGAAGGAGGAVPAVEGASMGTLVTTTVAL